MNAQPQSHPNERDYLWYAPTSDPFILEGMPYYEQNRNFCRLPKGIMQRQRDALQWTAWQPSGAVIRFASNTSGIAVRVRLGRTEHSSNGTIVQESGFDVYLDHGNKSEFHLTLGPKQVSEYFTATGELPGDWQEISIYFPILNPVVTIEIGLSADAQIRIAQPHKRGAICFYGSSITQGFHCSRPGLTYPAQICRRLDAELINLGFGGNARGDIDVAKAIGSLKLTALVLDYDHNSPTEELAQRHGPFFRCVRALQPDLPIIITSSPNWWKDPTGFSQRFEIIQQTFAQARTSGDKNVFLYPGKRFFSKRKYADFTVDRLHPNDAGFHRMAERIGYELEEALKAA